jgi:hypothetical protein
MGYIQVDDLVQMAEGRMGIETERLFLRLPCHCGEYIRFDLAQNPQRIMCERCGETWLPCPQMVSVKKVQTAYVEIHEGDN